MSYSVLLLAALVACVPLWASRWVPLVDLPQHLHLIDVLHRLNDDSALYGEMFARRPALTPYLGYYYCVDALAYVFDLEIANTVFLSLYAAGVPLATAYLLRGLGRPVWPAVLTVPFVYGDSFAWGFINYVSSLPLALLACGAFVRSIQDRDNRRFHAVLVALFSTLTLLFHVQTFAWLGLAIGGFLLLTPAPEGRSPKHRVIPLLSLLPSLALFTLWFGARVGQPAEIAPGQPWKAWGPMLSKENLAFRTFEQNRDELVSCVMGAVRDNEGVCLLANMLPDDADRRAVWLALSIAAVALVSWPLTRRTEEQRENEPFAEGWVSWVRLPVICSMAFALYFLLPFDIHGYMYYLSPRYAHLAAILLVACVPAVRPRVATVFSVIALVVPLQTAVPLYEGFGDFASETQALDELTGHADPKPRVMGLVFDASSKAVRHPVFLHASTVLARRKGGLANFSFAVTPHSPLMYRDQVPPTFPSEWRPQQMSYEREGAYYDHFLIRSGSPEEIFGSRLGRSLFVRSRNGPWTLVMRTK